MRETVVNKLSVVTTTRSRLRRLTYVVLYGVARAHLERSGIENHGWVCNCANSADPCARDLGAIGDCRLGASDSRACNEHGFGFSEFTYSKYLDPLCRGNGFAKTSCGCLGYCGVARSNRIKDFSGQDGKSRALEISVGHITCDDLVVLGHPFDHQPFDQLPDA